VNALQQARAHLTKAREFLEAAELARELDLCNAAASAAVTSGINSKDAICLALTGRTGKTENHHDARAELRAAGPAGRSLETTFSRLLRLKQKSQYQAASVSAPEAIKSVEWADRMLTSATEVVRG